MCCGFCYNCFCLMAFWLLLSTAEFSYDNEHFKSTTPQVPLEDELDYITMSYILGELLRVGILHVHSYFSVHLINWIILEIFFVMCFLYKTAHRPFKRVFSLFVFLFFTSIHYLQLFLEYYRFHIKIMLDFIEYHTSVVNELFKLMSSHPNIYNGFKFQKYTHWSSRKK